MAGADAHRRAVLIGAGRMGAAMARGWVQDLHAAGMSSLTVVEPNPDEEVREAAARGALALNPASAPADLVILAIKPQIFPAAAEALRSWVRPDTLVVSIMAGVPIDKIGASLGATRLARAMPNTPAAIGMGVTAFALSPACTETDVISLERLLEPLGLVVGPLAEADLDTVTAVSGSGPAYVFLLVEALAEAGRAAGLDDGVAMLLARETVIGAGALLGESSASASDLRHAVTSPGGTTAAALGVLMAKGGLPDLMKDAVSAAVTRARELSKG